MKDCLVIYYNINDMDVTELADIFHRLEGMKENKLKTIIALPDIVTLREYDKDDLKKLLEFYIKIIREFLNEQNI